MPPSPMRQSPRGVSSVPLGARTTPPARRDNGSPRALRSRTPVLSPSTPKRNSTSRLELPVKPGASSPGAASIVDDMDDDQDVATLSRSQRRARRSRSPGQSPETPRRNSASRLEVLVKPGASLPGAASVLDDDADPANAQAVALMSLKSGARRRRAVVVSEDDASSVCDGAHLNQEGVSATAATTSASPADEDDDEDAADLFVEPGVIDRRIGDAGIVEVPDVSAAEEVDDEDAFANVAPGLLGRRGPAISRQQLQGHQRGQGGASTVAAGDAVATSYAEVVVPVAFVSSFEHDEWPPDMSMKKGDIVYWMQQERLRAVAHIAMHHPDIFESTRAPKKVGTKGAFVVAFMACLARVPLAKMHCSPYVANNWVLRNRVQEYWRSEESLMEEVDRVHAMWRAWRVEELARTNALSRQGKQRQRGDASVENDISHEAGEFNRVDSEQHFEEGVGLENGDDTNGGQQGGVIGRGRGGQRGAARWGQRGAARGGGKGGRGADAGADANGLPYLRYRINLFGAPMGVGETKDGLPTTISRAAKERICKSAVHALTEWVQGHIDGWDRAGRDVSSPPLFTNWAAGSEKGKVFKKIHLQASGETWSQAKTEATVKKNVLAAVRVEVDKLIQLEDGERWDLSATFVKSSVPVRAVGGDLYNYSYTHKDAMWPWCETDRCGVDALAAPLLGVVHLESVWADCVAIMKAAEKNPHVCMLASKS